MTAIGRRIAGPGVRRLRREWQWRRCGASLVLGRAPAEGFGYPVAMHATPVFRRLAGVDQRLQRNKAVNLGLACARLDSLVLAPGQRFSFWWHVGRPSARRGYLPGVVLDHGRLVEGTGGGLCQLTNLVYWMTLHTPLTVVERWRHSHDVFPDVGRTQPFGTGATCAWPVLDLQIENTTNTSFRLGLRVAGGRLLGEWTADAPVLTGYQVYEAGHRMTNDAPGTFFRRNVIRRRVLDASGREVADELVAVNQALMMYQPFLDGRPGADHQPGVDDAPETP